MIADIFCISSSKHSSEAEPVFAGQSADGEAVTHSDEVILPRNVDSTGRTEADTWVSEKQNGPGTTSPVLRDNGKSTSYKFSNKKFG